MRHLALVLAVSSVALSAGEENSPVPDLQDYQVRALGHLSAKPGKLSFDPHSLDVIKMLGSVKKGEQKVAVNCVVPMPEIKGDAAIDRKFRLYPQGKNEHMPRLQGLQVCGGVSR